MKFVHFADLHLNNFEKRVPDVLDNLKRLVKYATKKQVDYVFFAGDAYKTYRPKNMYRTMFHDEIIKLTKFCKVVMIPGNHDMTRRDGSKHALSEFKHLQVPNVHVLDEVKFTEFDDCFVLSIPWQFIPLKIPNPPQTDKPIIALIHASVKGILPPVDTVETVLGGEFVINLNDFTFCDYIALGHIHKFMSFGNAIYPSSMEALTWGELGKHGFVYGEFNGKNVKWDYVVLPTRNRIDLGLHIENESDFIPPIINPDTIYRLTLKYYDRTTKVKNVGKYFKNAFEFKLREKYPPKVRQVVDLDKLLTQNKTEILADYLGEDFDSKTQILWSEIQHEVET